MQYTEIAISPALDATEVEVLTALLGDIGFESFVEQKGHLLAYVPSDLWDQDALDQLLANPPFLSLTKALIYERRAIPEENWNSVWESQYERVRFGDFCCIRAPFHGHSEGVRFDVIIEPKMSFGTAHHETTSLMIQWLENEEVQDKRFLDMGCGTGVLAILAAKLGAQAVCAIDNDAWAYENSCENIARNGVPEIEVIQGDAQDLKDRSFEMVFANINRNILIRDMGAYKATLLPKASLFLSGFYASDLPAVRAACEEWGLDYVAHLEKNNWVAAKFTCR